MKARHLVHAATGASIASALVMLALYLATSALGVPEIFDFLVFEIGLGFILLLIGTAVVLGWIRRAESRARLSTLEGMILDAIAARLTPCVMDVWDQQVKSIRQINRSSDGANVGFELGSVGRNPYLPLPTLPRQTTFVIGVVELMHPDLTDSIAAKVWFESGRLSSIEYVGGRSLATVREVLVRAGWNIVVTLDDDFSQRFAQE
ncbi:hypothetical protein IM816_13075 [Luteibacter flocculans]|uniref:Uncharacterized protein n=1 Tax=Luteibacter flocculans TaxID=2780091 RepID=A0ABY4T0C2_9GAMM|nr:hypothetical protein [Luteibacter flocculans]URL57550.1 hypothetical protein IM816_13075 [Luteibacter flocculans]